MTPIAPLNSRMSGLAIHAFVRNTSYSGMIYADERDALVQMRRAYFEADLVTRLSLDGRDALQDDDGARTADRLSDLFLSV